MHMHMYMHMHMHMVARLLLSDTLKLQVMPVKFYAELIPSNCLVGDSQPWAGDEHEAETLLLGPKSTITHPAMAEFYSRIQIRRLTRRLATLVKVLGRKKRW